MFLKVLGAILTITSCTALGFYFSSELNTRLRQLRDWKKYIMILRGDIQYGGTPLPEAIGSLARRSPGVFRMFLEKVSEELFKGSGGTFSEIWRQCVNLYLKNTSLTETDKEGIIRLGDNLGYLDREMQVNTIDLYLTQLQEEIKEQSIVAKERSKLYNILGIMAGLFITIVMI